MCCFAECDDLTVNVLLRKMCGLRPLPEGHTFTEGAYLNKFLKYYCQQHVNPVG